MQKKDHRHLKGTVRILLVAADGLQLAIIYLNQHSAKCWMTIHGTHGPHDSRGGHGHLHLRASSEILSEMGSAGTGPDYQSTGSAEWASARRPPIEGPQSCIDTSMVRANRMT
jgi:hypothetical protein